MGKQKEITFNQLTNIKPVTDSQKVVFDSWKQGQNQFLYGCAGTGVKTDAGFNETMAKIADKHPNSPLAERYGNKQSNNTIKVKNVAKKHKLVDIAGQNVTKHYEKNKTTGLY